LRNYEETIEKVRIIKEFCDVCQCDFGTLFSIFIKLGAGSELLAAM